MILINKLIPILVLLLFIFLSGGCVENGIQVPPFTTSQFVNQTTDANYTIFKLNGYDGMCVVVDGNKLNFGNCAEILFDANLSGSEGQIPFLNSDGNALEVSSGFDFNKDTNTLSTNCIELGDGNTYCSSADFPNPDLSGLVPYSGATSNVDLGFHVLTAENGLIVNSVGRPTIIGSATAVAGSGLEIGTYYYYVTYYTSIGETAVNSTARTVVTSSGNQQVSLAGIPTSSDGRVIGRRIYRGAVGQAYVVKLVVDIADNTTTTYVDSLPDASLTGDGAYFRDDTTTGYLKDGTTTVFSPGINVFRAGNSVGRDDAYGGRNALAGVNVLQNANSKGMSDTSAFGYGIGYTGGYSSSVFMGSYAAGALSSTGNIQVTAIGYGTLFGNYANSNRAISYSTAVGYSAGSAGSQYAALLGVNAGNRNRGNANSYFGAYSGYGGVDGTGASNVGVGYYSMSAITNGSLNSAIGRDSGRNLTNGGSNIFLGMSAGKYSTTEHLELFINSYDRGDRAGDLANSIIYGQQTSNGLGQSLRVNADLNIRDNFYVDNNIYAGYVHATDFITSSKVADVADGKKALDNLDNISNWLVTDAKSSKKVIDYDAHYAGVNKVVSVTDYSKPVVNKKLVDVCNDVVEYSEPICDSKGVCIGVNEKTKVVCEKEEIVETTYPYSILVEEKGLSMETRVAELEKMVYELKTALCITDSKHEFCSDSK